MKRALLILLLFGGTARADHGVIALLPLGTDGKLSLYGQPVAAEVAKALEQAGYSVVVVTSTAPVPSRARLVIDGRIVKEDDGSVRLEARVRDPAIGTVVGEVSASTPQLTHIDEAADALAADLARSIAAHDALPPSPSPTSQPPSLPASQPLPPPLHVSASSPHPSAGDPDVGGIVLDGAKRLARITKHPALTYSIDLLAIRYADVGVITGRARARVRVRDGEHVLFDRTVRTDTLVGGRGDRKESVAREAIEQVVDIVAPRVKEAVK